MSATPRSRNIAVASLVATVAFGTFAFGATEVWSRSVLRWMALATLLLAWWTPMAGSRLPATSRRMLWPALALLAFACVQVAPLPDALVSVLSPKTAELYERTVPPDGAPLGTWLVGRAADHGVVPDPDVPPPEFPEVAGGRFAGNTLSIAPQTTLRSIGHWLTALVLFCAAASLARDERLRYRMLWGIALVGGALGLVGIAQKISWNRMLLWIREPPPGTVPIGPYVNASHYAGQLEMTVLVAIGLGLALLAVHGRKLDLATVRAALVDVHWTLPRLALAAGCSVLGVAGLLASGSRGGLLAFAVGFLFLLFLRRSRALVIVLLISVAMTGLAAGLVAWVGDQEAELEGVPFALSGADPSSALRLWAWGATLDIFRDHLWTGTGLGTFRWAFPGYQRAGEWKEWGHAHNDYVQLLGETGVPGLLILIWALFVLARWVVVPIGSRSRGGPRWTSVGALAAVVAMLAHTVVDFNLQIPGNAALFAVLLGLVTAAAEDRPAPRPEDGE